VAQLTGPSLVKLRPRLDDSRPYVHRIPGGSGRSGPNGPLGAQEVAAAGCSTSSRLLPRSGYLRVMATEFVNNSIDRQPVAGRVFAKLTKQTHSPLELRACFVFGLVVLVHEIDHVLRVEFGACSRT
jgi:hypothetical protein